MSDYLDHLVARSLHRADIVQPRPASRFEPSGAGTLADPAAHAEAAQEEPFFTEASSAGRPTAQAHFTSSAESQPARSPVAQASAPPLDAVGRNGTHQPFAPAVHAVAQLQVPGPVHINSAEHPQSPAGDTPLSARRIEHGEPVDAPTERVTSRTATPPPRAVSAVEPPARSRSALTSPQETAPVIRISIGRVDVRAVMPAPAAPRSPARPAPSLSLEDYLKPDEGKRR